MNRGITRPALAGFAAGTLITVVALAAPPGRPPVAGAGRSIPPAAVPAGPLIVEPAAIVVPDDSGIPGVVAYETRGWPPSTGPAAPGALPHRHVEGPVRYSVVPPVGGDHDGRGLNCGIYRRPVPPEKAVQSLEGGAVWLTYRPALDGVDVAVLESFVLRQRPVTLTMRGSRVETHQRSLVLSPFPGLPAPIVASSWAHQLRVSSPRDPRLQRFVDTFRMSAARSSPEPGAGCAGQPEGIGGRPVFSEG